MSKIFNFPLQFNNPYVTFRSTQSSYAPVFNTYEKDSFVTNPLYKDIESAAQIEATAKSNQRIVKLLDEYNLPIKVNMTELEKLQKGHLQDTRVLAAKMYSALPKDIKQEIDMKQLQDAAKYHDYGKVLIPDKILNKQGELRGEEWEIMKLHSELGYELLKGKGLDNHTLELIKYHHQLPDSSGYPALSGRYEHGYDSQILMAADRYSALTEDRCYKSAMSRAEALNLIAQDVENGLISQEVYSALVKATS